MLSCKKLTYLFYADNIAKCTYKKEFNKSAAGFVLILILRNKKRKEKN